jgi:hypothetical protein
VQHQKHSKSVLPEDRLEALDNFQYLVQAESLMQGRVLFVPWEFLVYVVDHRTPLREREWSLANYLPKRIGIGKCYSDVPYDLKMYESQSKSSAMSGKPYTLPNLRHFGGVCAMQADFAARTAKSIGVPAAYVVGDSQYGEAHAWVMWIELMRATKSGVDFSLQSYGRYRGDKFYVGDLVDPKTGTKITDRDMEIRLHTVGRDAQGKRHADLAMKGFAVISSKLTLSTDDRFDYLNSVMKLCPGSERAWSELAAMSKAGQFEEKDNKRMMAALDMLFTNYARVPDFTWRIFDDLISFEQDPVKQIELYSRVIEIYESAGRPDLACKARLKWAEYLERSERYGDALEGLAYTCLKFPTEGRFVPKMLERMEKICAKFPEEGNKKLMGFYTKLLPLVPTKRLEWPSQYCISVHEKALALFEQCGEVQLAALCRSRLEAIKAGKDPK